MTDIDRILEQARLVPTPDYTQADIDAALDRLIARVNDPHTRTPVPVLPHDDPGGRDADTASTDLATLCEAILAQSGVTRLQDFLAPSCLPETEGARLLGCLLSLAGARDSARFWWQYASGAGDHPAAYCLALYHQAHGEIGEADWWHTQAQLTPLETDDLPPMEQLRRDLRILRILKDREGRPLPAPVAAALAYVPAAVGWVDDLELPLPDHDFPQRVAAMVAALTAPAVRSANPSDRLPARTGWHGPGIRQPIRT